MTDENIPMLEQAQTGEGSTTFLQLQIDQIHPYERNPRHGANPEFDRIKASIREAGLDQPLVVTQRPGSDDYIVHAGGNTRLLALKQLFKETNDDRFVTVQCLFRSWHCESDVLLAHLRENDLRGGLIFIDKARAVMDIKQLLEQELGVSKLSHRQLHTALKTGGYALSEGLISRMRYAVDTLLPLIPQALEAGLGRPQVQKIRMLDRVVRQIWLQRDLGNEQTFDEVFATLCRRYDHPDWDTEQLLTAIESEIAEQAEIDIQTVRMELDALLAGKELTIPDFVEGDPEQIEASDPLFSASPVNQANEDALEPAAGDIHEDQTSNETDDTDLSDHREDPQDFPDGFNEATTSNAVDRILTTESTAPTDLKSLRARSWTLAARLAQRNGIGDLVVPLSGQGLGYVLQDVPDPSLADQLDEDSLSQISMLWWQLAACAEMTVAPVESITATLPEDSILRRALALQDADLLFNSIWTLDPGHAGYRLWRVLADRDWHDLLLLMDNYRRIHRLAEDNQTTLWE